MRPLALDYQRAPGGSNRAGVALFVIGAVAAVVLVQTLARLDQRTIELQAQLGRLERRHVPVTKGRLTEAQSKQLSEQVAFADAVAERLTLPWEDVLQAIESARAKDVALLGLDPDATKRLVRINAEARTRPAMLAFVQQLSGDARLRDVHLIEHESQAQTQGLAVRFAVQAAWTPKSRD
jgi:Tfp pilus assembly protein PilN